MISHEFDEYLQRVEYVHNKLDTNLFHITKTTIPSHTISEGESDKLCGSIVSDVC